MSKHRARGALAHLAFILAILVAAGAIAHAVRAHGVGKPQLLNVSSGPYLLSIWTDPDPLRADEAHVVVAVLEPDTQELIVTDVVVTVRFTSLDDPARTLTEIAATDNTNQLLYAAEFNDRLEPGRWQVGVTPTGARGVGEEVTFAVVVEPGRGFNWLWAGAAGLGLLMAAWVISAMRAGNARRGARRR